MERLNEADPIWGEVPADVWSYDYGGKRVRSPRCGGTFVVGPGNLKVIRSLQKLEKAKLTTLILERNRFGDEWPTITDEMLDQARTSKAMSTARRIDRLLEYLAHRGFRPGRWVLWLGVHTQTEETRITA